jgi:hypothetical protein
MANARRIDRPVGAAGLDAGDKEIAKSLRRLGKKKRRKKDTGRAAKVVQAVGLSAALIGLIAFGAYMLWPESIDAGYARVEATGDPEAKLAAAAKFLSDHGHQADDPRVLKAVELYRPARVKAAEKVLANVTGGRLRSAADVFPKEPKEAAVLAVEAEKAGELKRAENLWADVKAKCPPVEPAKIADEYATNRWVLGWVADHHLALIREGLPEAVAKVRKQIEDDRTFDRDWKFAPTDPDGQAARALRLEAVNDRAKARRVWDGLARQTEADPDQRVWYLLASRQLAEITDKRPDAEVAAARLSLVAGAIGRLEAEFEMVKADPDKGAVRRDIRNGCRELIALYDDESADAIKAAVGRAKRLLEAAIAAK